MEYRVIRTGQSDDHFEHALFGGGRQKGAQNKNHKYLARAWWRNKWRYAYTQAEVAALQNLGKARQAAKDTADKAKAGAAKVTKTVSDVASGKYARDVDSRADRYAESAAQRSAASKRQSASGREQHETYLTANKVAEYNEEKANKFTNKLTGKSKMYKEAATSDRNAAKTAAAESSRLMTMSRENAAAARSDAKKAAEAEAEKNTAAYKISKAAGNASRAARNAADRVSDTARDVGNRVSNAARGASSAVKSAGEKVTDAANRATDSIDRAVDKVKDTATTAARKAAAQSVKMEYGAESPQYRAAKAQVDYDKAVDDLSEARDKYGVNSSQYKQAMRNEAAAREEKNEALKAAKLDSRKSNSEKAKERITSAASSASEKGKAAVEKLFNRASSAVKSAGEKVTDAANRATDSIDRAVDKVKDTATTAARKAAAQSVKMEYGAESPQYRAAKAQVDYDKAVDDLSEARDKYGVNSSQYKQAMRNEAAAREEKNEALKAAKLDSRKSNSEKAKERITSAASSASEKGKAAVEKLFNRASSAVKSAGEKVTDAASKAYGNAKTQIDLAENAINESRFDRYGENRIKNAQKKIDSIDKELADYEKEAAKDSVFKEQNQGWLRIKQRERAEAVKELSEAKKWQKDWEDSDKTLYRMTDEVSDMNPNMRKSEPITSSQRKEEIKEQNLYKYNSDYRKASDRASEIGSYLDNWDARGGPQTTEGKASYNKMMRELKQLESELEKMRK